MYNKGPLSDYAALLVNWIFTVFVHPENIFANGAAHLRRLHIPVSILYKSITNRYQPVRVADGPITARCRFIKNASWDTPF